MNFSPQKTYNISPLWYLVFDDAENDQRIAALETFQEQLTTITGGVSELTNLLYTTQQATNTAHINTAQENMTGMLNLIKKMQEKLWAKF